MYLTVTVDQMHDYLDDSMVVRDRFARSAANDAPPLDRQVSTHAVLRGAAVVVLAIAGTSSVFG